MGEPLAPLLLGALYRSRNGSTRETFPSRQVIYQNRKSYIKALHASDVSLAKSGSPNLKKMKRVVEDAVTHQLASAIGTTFLDQRAIRGPFLERVWTWIGQSPTVDPVACYKITLKLDHYRVNQKGPQVLDQGPGGRIPDPRASGRALLGLRNPGLGPFGGLVEFDRLLGLVAARLFPSRRTRRGRSPCRPSRSRGSR